MTINPMTNLPQSKPIKRFKELYIGCDEAAARAFFATLMQYVREGRNKRWVVDDEGMEFLLRGPAFEDGLFCTVILLDDAGQQYAAVTLKYDEGEKRIWVCNIVPCKVQELTIDQYNNALDQFRTDLVEPCRGTLECKVTSDSFVGAGVMSEGTWKQLKAFSVDANRSSLHPLDNQQWHRFVISAFKNDPKLDGYTLGQVLQMQLGWDDKTTFGLVVRYEDEIALLREYNGLPL